MWGWCTMWDGRSDTANEGNQLLQPELESKGGNDSETHEYMVLTKALPEISLSWKIELWWLQRVRMIASVTMLQELYKERPNHFRQQFVLLRDLNLKFINWLIQLLRFSPATIIWCSNMSVLMASFTLPVLFLWHITFFFYLQILAFWETKFCLFYLCSFLQC